MKGWSSHITCTVFTGGGEGVEEPLNIFLQGTRESRGTGRRRRGDCQGVGEADVQKRVYGGRDTPEETVSQVVTTEGP